MTATRLQPHGYSVVVQVRRDAPTATLGAAVCGDLQQVSRELWQEVRCHKPDNKPDFWICKECGAQLPDCVCERTRKADNKLTTEERKDQHNQMVDLIKKPECRRGDSNSP